MYSPPFLYTKVEVTYSDKLVYNGTLLITTVKVIFHRSVLSFERLTKRAFDLWVDLHSYAKEDGQIRIMRPAHRNS
jgi:hypothetical protein